jgi:hypothetical protein
MPNKMKGNDKAARFSARKEPRIIAGDFELDVRSQQFIRALSIVFPTIDQLTLDEKLALLSGKTLWLLADLPRFEIPSITVMMVPTFTNPSKCRCRELPPPRAFPPPRDSLAVGILPSSSRLLRYSRAFERFRSCTGPGLNYETPPAGVQF